MKKSVVDEVKKCLKNGVPVAALAFGVMAAGAGCDDNSSKTENPLPPPTTEEQFTRDEIIRLRREMAAPEKPAVVKKIEFNDSDFTRNLSKLSTAGEKKLAAFMGEVAQSYDFSYSIKIDIADADAKRKRKKAKVIFDKFSFVFYTTSGIGLTPERIAAQKIATALNAEFDFRNESKRW